MTGSSRKRVRRDVGPGELLDFVWKSFRLKKIACPPSHEAFGSDEPLVTTLSRHPMLARERLADPTYGRTIAAMVRRRVPASEVEDVTQTVLCDALDAPRLPTEPSDLRRFLCVLARNKIVDFHRREQRCDRTTDPTETAVCEPAPVEARALLERVVDATSPRDRETLDWLVREHDGEQLAEIAEAAGLPAPTVRQRVSRLRRALRARWSHAFALLLLVGTGGVAVERFTRDDGTTITADPAGEPGANALALAQGRWRVEEGASLRHESGKVIDPRLVELRVHGRTIEVLAPLHVATFSITQASATGDGSYALELRDAKGRLEHASVRMDGGAVLVTLLDGPVRGTARLARK